jgi:hypothetical protein
MGRGKRQVHKKMNWPLNKDFAFTIIDDTDYSTIDNTKPVYDYLKSKNLKTAKSIWIFPPNDHFSGQTLQDNEYFDFLVDLEREGFEIILHGVGSGVFKRTEVADGFEIFNRKFGKYPSVFINHSLNPENIYWGYKRFGPILRFFTKHIKGDSRRFYGDEFNSEFFWGDLSKKHIKYIRNRVFNGINTIRYDPKMPFKERHKVYSNYWFSSSDGHTIEEFNNLTCKRNVDRLVKQRGLSVIYTHFACGFVDQGGELDCTFKKNIDYISSSNGWFAPISAILDHLLSFRENSSENLVNNFYTNKLDAIWLIDRIRKMIRYGR